MPDIPTEQLEEMAQADPPVWVKEAMIHMARELLRARPVIAAADVMKPDTAYSLPDGTPKTMGVLMSQRELGRLADALRAYHKGE